MTTATTETLGRTDGAAQQWQQHFDLACAEAEDAEISVTEARQERHLARERLVKARDELKLVCKQRRQTAPLFAGMDEDAEMIWALKARAANLAALVRQRQREREDAREALKAAVDRRKKADVALAALIEGDGQAAAIAEARANGEAAAAELGLKKGEESSIPPQGGGKDNEPEEETIVGSGGDWRTLPLSQLDMAGKTRRWLQSVDIKTIGDLFTCFAGTPCDSRAFPGLPIEDEADLREQVRECAGDDWPEEMDAPAVALAPQIETPAPTDPLAAPCPKCRAPAGSKCRNYKGQNKQPCPARGKPAEPEPPTSASQTSLPVDFLAPRRLRVEVVFGESLEVLEDQPHGILEATPLRNEVFGDWHDPDCADPQPDKGMIAEAVGDALGYPVDVTGVAWTVKGVPEFGLRRVPKPPSAKVDPVREVLPPLKGEPIGPLGLDPKDLFAATWSDKWTGKTPAKPVSIKAVTVNGRLYTVSCEVYRGQSGSWRLYPLYTSIEWINHSGFVEPRLEPKYPDAGEREAKADKQRREAHTGVRVRVGKREYVIGPHGESRVVAYNHEEG